ncbi:MAG: nucleotidyltransferase domain-containing protein [Candidatus Thorarchaeota archaeon]|nr:nucleotidyltransferase domain-containing protein [Candidatus Thorarchaeota archaeon]
MDNDIEKILITLRNDPNVIAVFLFGSVAKGEAKPLSDTDIAVILDKTDSESEADIGSLYSDRIDLVLFHRLPLHIQFNVLKEGIEIFNKNETHLLEIKKKVLRNYLEISWLYRRISEGVGA